MEKKKLLKYGAVATLVVAIVGATWGVASTQAQSFGGWGPSEVAEYTAAFVGNILGGNFALPEVNEPEFGGGSRFPSGLVVGSSTPVTGQLIVGDNGTAIDDVIHGSCNATGPSAGISASSTAVYFCSATGVEVGDRIFVSLPSGANVDPNKAGAENAFPNPADGMGWLSLSGAAYSTTSNVFGFEIINYGAATTSFSQATTGIKWLVIRP